MEEIDRNTLRRAAELKESDDNVDIDIAIAAGIDKKYIDEAIRDRSREGQKRRAIAQLAVLAIALVLFVYALLWSTLLGFENQVEIAKLQVLNVYQRKVDLLPELMQLSELSDKGQVNRLQKALDLQKEYAAESDPKLKLQLLKTSEEMWRAIAASSNIRILENHQTEIVGTENRIAVEKRVYFRKLAGYNDAVRRLPLPGFHPQEPAF